MKVNILGTEYTIEYKADEQIAKDMDTRIGVCGGYCSPYDKLIAIGEQDTIEEEEKVIEALKRLNLRHEIIHAFLHESGLYENSLGADNWAMNEEMVDWMALQFPKMLKAFEEAGAIETESPQRITVSEEGITWTVNPNFPGAINPIYYPNDITCGTIKADKPSGKVYIATMIDKSGGEAKSYNGGVFTTREKAIECIKKRGFTLLSPYNDYRNPEDMECIQGCYGNAEWLRILEKYSQNGWENAHHKNFWLETVRYKDDVRYRIEEHYIDLEE